MKKIRKIRPYNSLICQDAHLRPICSHFGLRVRLMDLINCAKFYHNRSKGLDFLMDRFWPLPKKWDVAVNTALPFILWWNRIVCVLCVCVCVCVCGYMVFWHRNVSKYVKFRAHRPSRHGVGHFGGDINFPEYIFCGLSNMKSLLTQFWNDKPESG